MAESPPGPGMTYFLRTPIPDYRPGEFALDEPHALVAFSAPTLKLLLMQSSDGSLRLPLREELGELQHHRPLGILGQERCALALIAKDAKLPDGAVLGSVRRWLGALSDPVLMLAALGSQLAHQEQTQRHCGTCGARLTRGALAIEKVCETCDSKQYPAIAPCVIALVHDSAGRILLTRAPHFPPGMFGLVAGFVEPGESLEDCVAREVAEETGIQVTDVSYVASQPWPFPSQLMVGFQARATTTELTIDTSELAEAGFYAPDQTPTLPPPFSIARFLIDEFIRQRVRA